MTSDFIYSSTVNEAYPLTVSNSEPSSVIATAWIIETNVSTVYWQQIDTDSTDDKDDDGGN